MRCLVVQQQVAEHTLGSRTLASTSDKLLPHLLSSAEIWSHFHVTRFSDMVELFTPRLGRTRHHTEGQAR